MNGVPLCHWIDVSALYAGSVIRKCAIGGGMGVGKGVGVSDARMGRWDERENTVKVGWLVRKARTSADLVTGEHSITTLIPYYLRPCIPQRASST